MSAPVYDFTCTRCVFEGSYASGSGAHVYRSAQGRDVHVPSSTAWCAGCGTIRRIQNGLSITALQAECDRLKRMLPRKRSLLARLFRREESEAIRRRKQVQVNEQLLAALGGHDSADACLSCGGTDVQRIDWGAADETPRPISHSHPGCGGHLLVSTQLRIAWHRRTVVVAPVFAEAPARG